MANTQISNLPLYTGDTTGAYLVMNNSGETTTYKVLKENIVTGGGNTPYTPLNYPILLSTSIAQRNWRPFQDLVLSTTATYSVTANRTYMTWNQLENGTNITDFLFNVVSSGNQISIGLYSFSEWTDTDGQKYYYPSTLQYTFASLLDVSTTGLKTITGLNYTIDNSLTVGNLWGIGFSVNAIHSLSMWNTSGVVRRGDFGVSTPTAGGSSFNTSARFATGTGVMLPSTIAPQTTTVANIGEVLWCFLKYTIPA